MTQNVHTPYDGSHKPFTIGLNKLDLADWIEVDENLGVYLDEKHRLYAAETANVLVAEAGTEVAQQEVLDLLVEHLPQRFPEQYKKTADAIQIFRHPGEGRGEALPHAAVFEDELDPGLRRDAGPTAEGERLTQSPLARAGLLVQEDLVLMRRSASGWRLVAASLCFPSAWNLHEKFGKPMHDIHQPVPGFGEGTRNASLIERMFEALRPEMPVIRWNWSFYGDTKLYHPASDNQMKRRFGDGNIEGRVTLRLERQTLRKLPKSGDILFTIRIHIDPLEVLQSHPEGAALAGAMNSQLLAMSDAEISYKGLADERARLSARLSQLAGV